MAWSRLSLSVSSALLLLLACRGTHARPAEAAWPNGPFVTDGRWIRDASGANLTYAGVNWPGAADVMIPEGLQYQSIESIVTQFAGLGMNAIRLTYAIEMIDQIYDNGGRDVPIRTALTRALGAAHGAQVFGQIVAKNPQFDESTTRLQVFDAVAAECARQRVFVHLDNHISKGMWCCSSDDGNAWWGDRYFSLTNWTRGLSYMANHGKSWPNLMSMSLRNELRDPTSNPALSRSRYNWQDWYANVRRGADAIHAAHPDVLIFLSGLNFDTTLAPVVQGTALTPGAARFDRADFAGYADKLVLEIHNYENSASSCAALQGDLRGAGFSALEAGAPHPFPVLLTEYGFPMDASTWKGVYASCIAGYMPARKAGWFLWVLAGSYYIRSGRQDYDETWGLLTHDWSTWRSPSFVSGQLTAMVQNTLS